MKIFNEYMDKKLIFSYEITRGCNLRCPYCYEKNLLNNKQNYNPIIAKKVIEAFKDFKFKHPEYKFELDLLGGDPLFSNGIFDFLDMWFNEINSDIWVVTNLVPKDNNKIIKLAEYLKKYDRLGVSATWHDSANADIWKENMLYLKQFEKMRYAEMDEIYFPNIVAGLVLMNDEAQYDKYLYLKEQNIQYGITHYYDDNHLSNRVFKKYNKQTQEIYENSINYKQIFYTIDNEKFFTDKFEELELYEISHQYDLICSVLNYNIDYNGNIFNSCSYRPKIEYHINDGIQIHSVFCKDTYCHCSGQACKRLLRKRNE